MLSPKSIKNLRRVEKFLLKEPRRFNMSAGVEASDMHQMKEQPPCGTACCIGGAAYILDTKLSLTVPETFGWDPVEKKAQEFLSLSNTQCFHLFHLAEWPGVFKKMYKNAKSAHELAAVGILRIEHFISTNGDE